MVQSPQIVNDEKYVLLLVATITGMIYDQTTYIY